MKIFVLTSRVPYPLEKGDKLRAFNFIKHLSGKHEIVLCCLSDRKIESKSYQILNQYCSKVVVLRLSKFTIAVNLIKNIFKTNPFQIAYFYDPKVSHKISDLIEAEKPDHIFCQLIRTAEYVKHYNIPKTIDYQDAFSEGIRRRIKFMPMMIKPIFKIEFNRLRKYESSVFKHFDNKIIISAADRKFIHTPNQEDIKVVKNGVDFDYFNIPKQEKIYDLLFLGNMSYPPNIMAAKYLVDNILPLFAHKNQAIKLLIAGTSPTDEVLKFQSENVVVSGWIDDVRNCYAQSKIFVAPMLIGTGLQNKLLEAMAMGLPCITSKLANESLQAKEGENILIAEKPKDYFNYINEFLTNSELYNQYSINGRMFVEKNYNWNNICDTLSLIIK